jgi:archaemetzincin
MLPIRIWWIGEGAPRAGTLEHVRLHVERALGRPAAVLDRPERPQGTLDPRRRQHQSGKLLAWLLQVADGEGIVLGVTDVDLFIPILTFVFGEAQLGGRAAVVSTARLADAAERDPRVLVERLAKEAVHELGHALGLVHCAAPPCAMSRSSGVRDVDRKLGELCSDCRSRLAEFQGRRSGQVEAEEP